MCDLRIGEVDAYKKAPQTSKLSAQDLEKINKNRVAALAKKKAKEQMSWPLTSKDFIDPESGLGAYAMS